MKIDKTNAPAGAAKTAKSAAPTPELEIRYVPITHLGSHAEIKNRAMNDPHVLELTESIKSNGLDTPLLVWSGSDKPGGMMTIKSSTTPVPGCFVVAGFHRRAALRRLLKTDEETFKKRFPNGIPVKYINGSLADALAAQLRENANRLEPEVGEVVPLVVRLSKDFKLKGRQIAAKVGKSEAWVSQMLDIERQLGEDGTKAVSDGSVTVRDAIKGAKEVKSGKSSKEAAVGKLKDKAAKKKAGAPEEKRISAKTAHARYTALPSMKLGARLELLEKLLAYLAGQSDELPEELQGDSEQPSRKKDAK